MFEDTDFLGMTFYRQKEKIDELYSKMVDKVIKQYSTELQNIKEYQIEGGISLGQVLAFLGLGAKFGGHFKKQDTNSIEVVAELSEQSKLLIALNALQKMNEVSDLNKVLQTNEQTVMPYVYFEGKAKFEKNADPDMVSVSGEVENRKFMSYCSNSHMTPSLRKSLLESGLMPVFCVGNILSFDQQFVMTFFYVGGSIDNVKLS